MTHRAPAHQRLPKTACRGAPGAIRRNAEFPRSWQQLPGSPLPRGPRVPQGKPHFPGGAVHRSPREARATASRPGGAVRFVALVGNPKPGSRTLTVAAAAAEAIALAAGVDEGYEIIDLSVLSRRLLLPEPSMAVEDATELVSRADLLLVASPTFKGTYTGLLKVFLDRLPYHGLAGNGSAALARYGFPAARAGGGRPPAAAPGRTRRDRTHPGSRRAGVRARPARCRTPAVGEPGRPAWSGIRSRWPACSRSGRPRCRPKARRRRPGWRSRRASRTTPGPGPAWLSPRAPASAGSNPARWPPGASCR